MDIFGTEDVVVEKQGVSVNGHSYPVVDDVIILLSPSQYPPTLSKLLNYFPDDPNPEEPEDFAEDIQFTFGAEWLTYPEILPEHEEDTRKKAKS